MVGTLRKTAMTYLQLEEDYDVAIDEIKCNADKIGAKVFIIRVMNRDVRVLAYNREQAREKVVYDK